MRDLLKLRPDSVLHVLKALVGAEEMLRTGGSDEGGETGVKKTQNPDCRKYNVRAGVSETARLFGSKQSDREAHMATLRRKGRVQRLDFNDRDKLALFLMRISELTARRYYQRFDWNAIPGLTFQAADDDSFAAFILTFRHFYSNDSPTAMGRIHGILARAAQKVSDIETIDELAGIKQEFDQGPSLRLDVFDAKGTGIEKFSNEQIFDLYINCRYFHTDPRGVEFFFKMPEPYKTECHKAFQLALVRYVKRFHAYVPIILKVMKSNALRVGLFDLYSVDEGQSSPRAGILVKIPKAL